MKDTVMSEERNPEPDTAPTDKTPHKPATGADLIEAALSLPG